MPSLLRLIVCTLIKTSLILCYPNFRSGVRVILPPVVAFVAYTPDPFEDLQVKTSENGFNLIKQFEGLRLEPYQDGGGVWTIGYGHTGNAVNNPKISKRKAVELLHNDVAWAEKAISKLVDVPLNQNQYDALVSFVYNIGETQFRNSTLLRVLNRGDYKGAAKQLLRWEYDNGRKVLGLSKRRKIEKVFFEKKPTIGLTPTVTEESYQYQDEFQKNKTFINVLSVFTFLPKLIRRAYEKVVIVLSKRS